jgi:meiotically up-regulated gene 157 (Mug157) protein
MAATALSFLSEIFMSLYGNWKLADTCRALGEEIRLGINRYGKAEHPKYGIIYAYETDGLGNYNMMDDANSPSLLALPYLHYLDAGDELYQNTRRFVLSSDNPYYYKGRMASGVGSPHTPSGYVWHIGIIMQALTSRCREEILQCLSYIADTHAGTNFMHESFNPDRPEEYTREWFSWANSLFASLMVKLENENFFD